MQAHLLQLGQHRCAPFRYHLLRFRLPRRWDEVFVLPRIQTSLQVGGVLWCKQSEQEVSARPAAQGQRTISNISDAEPPPWHTQQQLFFSVCPIAKHTAACSRCCGISIGHVWEYQWNAWVSCCSEEIVAPAAVL